MGQEITNTLDPFADFVAAAEAEADEDPDVDDPQPAATTAAVSESRTSENAPRRRFLSVRTKGPPF